MQYSDTTGLTGLVQDTHFICGTDSTSYPLTDMTRNMNRHAYRAVVDVMKVSKTWIYNDSNNSGSPYVDVTMTNGSRVVSLPAFLKINAVEILDNDGTTYTRLEYFDLMDLSDTISSFQTTSGKPTRYSLTGNQIWFDLPVSSSEVTVTSGLRLWITPEIDVFISTDTNQELGITEPFHRIVSVGAACDWLAVNATSEKYNNWLAQYEQLRAELKAFYSERNMDVEYKLQPDHDVLNYI